MEGKGTFYYIPFPSLLDLYDIHVPAILTPYNMTESWNHDAQWKKPVPKGHTVSYFMYVKYPE